MRIFKDYFQLGDDQKFSKHLFWHTNRKNTKLINQHVGKEYFSKIAQNLARWLGKRNWKCYRSMFFLFFLVFLRYIYFHVQVIHSEEGASLMANAGASPSQIMIWGCWSSITIALGYVEESILSKKIENTFFRFNGKVCFF